MCSHQPNTMGQCLRRSLLSHLLHAATNIQPQRCDHRVQPTTVLPFHADPRACVKIQGHDCTIAYVGATIINTSHRTKCACTNQIYCSAYASHCFHIYPFFFDQSLHFWQVPPPRCSIKMYLQETETYYLNKTDCIMSLHSPGHAPSSPYHGFS